MEKGLPTSNAPGNERRKDDPPLVSVVIVNWNACEPLALCLDSLLEHHRGLHLEIWVVDNASSDCSVEMLKTRYPGVRLIENAANRGFAAANNQAFTRIHPESPYVLVLNPDVVFTGSTLEILSAFLSSRKDVHAVTPRVVDSDGRIQRGCRRRLPSPGIMFSSLFGLSRLFPQNRKLAAYTYADLPENQTHRVEAASGCFLLIRHEVLRAVGGFDERFFLYGEDLDWCLRANRQNFSIYYHPASSVVHARGASSFRRPLRRLWYLHYTAYLYIQKHHRKDYSLPLRLLLFAALGLRLAFFSGTELAKTLLARKQNQRKSPKCRYS